VSAPAALADDAGALAGIVEASPESIGRLRRLAELIEKWQRAENLVAPKTLPHLWRRHIADSAQLVPLFPKALRWLDLGSGAGFPGLVIASLIAERGGRVDLVESNSRKCAFLRTAIRETGAPAIVREGRIEAVVADWREPVDVVTARAVAPLEGLLGLAAPLIGRGARGAFLKGQDFAREIFEASKSWDFDLVEHRSKTDDSGVILEIGRVAPKAATKRGGLA
jgi:16S rRNA (guanine527-N7)-methyltransferase